MRCPFLPWYEEIEDPADVEKAIRNSKIQYDKNGELVDVRYQRDIKGYAEWQAGNRQLNRELLEYEQMKYHYGDTMPYKSLGSFRRASRAQTETYKELRKNLRDILTTDEIDVIITNEEIKEAFGDKAVTLEEAISKADPLVANAFDRYQHQLKIIDANYKTTEEQSAHFDPDQGGILFDIEEDSQSSDSNRKQFNTYFHETGHHLDFLIGKKLGNQTKASLSYRSKTFAEKIAIRGKNGKQQGLYIREPNFHDMIVEETNIYLENCRKILQRERGHSVSDNELYKEIQKIFAPVDLANKRQLADIFDGVTEGKMTKKGYFLGAGHKPEYWKTHKAGSEAFAHFTAILATNKPIIHILEKYFPKSLAIYKEIMEL